MIRRCVAAGTAALVTLIAVVASAAPVGGGPMLDPERGVLTYAPLLEQVTGAVVNIATRSRGRLPGNPCSTTRSSAVSSIFRTGRASGR
jgi:hypothetical protein